MEVLNIRTGKSLHNQAPVEVDKDKLKSRVGAAKTAIFNRLQAISHGSDHAAERQAIANALALIGVLKREALDFPEWEKEIVRRHAGQANYVLCQGARTHAQTLKRVRKLLRSGLPSQRTHRCTR
jgi:hypothetical protein